MKTAEIEKAITEIYPNMFAYTSKESKEGMLDAIQQLLNAQFSQQPTEKTREGAINELEKQSMSRKHACVCIDALIQSGYIQSDSVDGEQALQIAFKKEWGNPPFNEKEVTHLAMRHMFRAGFLAGSKVKPVNEKMREALENLIGSSKQMITEEIWKEQIDSTKLSNSIDQAESALPKSPR